LEGHFGYSAFNRLLILINCGPMNVDLGIWSKLSRMVLLLLFLAGILGIVIWYLPVIRQNEATRKRILQMNAQIKQEEERGKHLDYMYKAIRNDPKTVERIARERLGFGKTGETLIRFEEPVSGSLSTNH
jgi:cell division protein FtsB